MTKWSMPQTLDSLALVCGGKVVGNGKRLVAGFCSINQPKVDCLAYVASSSFLSSIDFDLGEECFYIVKPDWQSHVKNGIVHDRPQQAFRLITQQITAHQKPFSIEKTAIIAGSAKISDNVSIGHHAIIGEGVTIESGCRIGDFTIIEDDSFIGSESQLDHHVTIYGNTMIGKSCTIKSNSVIGGSGFGFSPEGGEWFPMPQLGKVIIGDRVHIGSNSCVDRGAINDTIIGNNVIMDNLVHIAHNVTIGDHTAMASGVGVAGSTHIGKHCVFAGKVGVAGHITITDGVQIHGGSRVLKSIKMPGKYSGSFHVLPSTKWNRVWVYLKKIETLFSREKNI